MGKLETIEEFQKLVISADKEKPKKADLVALERFLDSNPELWRIVDLTERTTLNAIENEVPTQGTQAVLKRNYYGIKKDQGYEQANALERLLIDHLALCA